MYIFQIINSPCNIAKCNYVIVFIPKRGRHLFFGRKTILVGLLFPMQYEFFMTSQAVYK